MRHYIFYNRKFDIDLLCKELIFLLIAVVFLLQQV